ncbi:MAG: DUF3857 domain-containing protein [Planctomycetes bacterium]|nr:DUF3857 domain-containing protein [Planctomycetota bacterium]
MISLWEDAVAPVPEGGYTWSVKKHVRVNNDRSYGAFADPRITYNADYQTVKIMTARTRCPDGRVVEVPKYSRNEVAPHETAGWPALAAIRQIVVSFSAIEPGAVLELEYEIVSKRGALPFDEFDFQIATSYPIALRRILRNGKPIHEASNVEPLIDEPLSLPARDRNGLKVLTTAANTKAWATAILNIMDDLTRGEKCLPYCDESKLAATTDHIEKAWAIQEAFARQFTTVDAPSACVWPALRPTTTVRSTHYGTSLEAASLLLAMFRGTGLKAEPVFAVASQSDDISIGAISAFAVALETRGEISYWHAMQGRIRNPGPWGGWRRFDRAFVTGRSDMPARFDAPVESRLEASARLALDETASYTGSVDLRMTGLFLTNALRTDEQKKSAINEALSRLIPNVDLSKYSVTTLSNDVFAVNADVKSSKPLEMAGDGRVFAVPSDGAWLSPFPLPLGKSGRKTLLKTPGAFVQESFIEIKLPDGWSASALPKSYGTALANDANLSQQVEAVGQWVRLRNNLTVSQRIWPAERYSDLRAAICNTQSPAARTLVIRKASAVSGR